ncbi:MAG: DUF4375 domain-containing protein [Planctomycetales bacterium]
MGRTRFDSIAALIEHDAASPLASDEFDTQLWLLMIQKIDRPSDLEHLPRPVAVYHASRLLQWEVLNGGFGQAAGNIPVWFELAAVGYSALGMRKSAGLIREARDCLTEDRIKLIDQSLLDESTIEKLAALDERIPEDEFCIDDERVEYVRKHRDAFRIV